MEKGKTPKGCSVAAIIIFCFVCLCITLTLVFGDSETSQLSEDAKLIKTTCDISDEQAIAIEEIFKECEIAGVKKIEYDDLLDDMFNKGDRGYRLQTADVKNIIVYLNSEKELIAIRHASVDLYSEKRCKEKLTAFYLTSEQCADLRTASEEYVKSVLRSPSTADFPWFDWNFSKDYSSQIATVSSYVDAKNAFGAEVRSYFTLMYKTNGNRYSLLYFELNGEVIADYR